MMFCVLLNTVIILTVQTSLYSSAEEYITSDLSGTLNILLTAPHGGKLTALTPDVPDREDGCFDNGMCVFNHSCVTQDPTNCGVVIQSDYQTDDLAQRLHSEIYNLKGEWPKIVINNVHRKKLDANRERGEATFGEEFPGIVYDWYHSNISAGVSTFGGQPGIIFDIHGYSDGNDNGLALLGYRISGSNLNNLDNSAMNALVNDSSIAILAASHKTTNTFSDLLRGSGSFGAIMTVYGLDSTPSPQTTGPGAGKYYSGGYTTELYKTQIDVIQVEVHYYHRSNSTMRQDYAEKLAKAIVDFYDTYYVQGTTTQSATSTFAATSTESKANQPLSSFALRLTFIILTVKQSM